MSTNLMNGTEQPDFYASANQSDLFKVPSRDRISYHEDGRVMMDGKVVEEKDPEQMWRDLIVIMMTKKINRYCKWRLFVYYVLFLVL